MVEEGDRPNRGRVGGGREGVSVRWSGKGGYPQPRWPPPEPVLPSLPQERLRGHPLRAPGPSLAL